MNEVMEKSRPLHGECVSIRVFSGDGSSKSAGFAVVASKKVAKTAVDRNRIRRRVYAAIRKTDFFQKMDKKDSPRQAHQTHCVVFAKTTALEAPLQSLTTELNTLFIKSGAFGPLK